MRDAERGEGTAWGLLSGKDREKGRVGTARGFLAVLPIQVDQGRGHRFGAGEGRVVQRGGIAIHRRRGRGAPGVAFRRVTAAGCGVGHPVKFFRFGKFYRNRGEKKKSKERVMACFRKPLFFCPGCFLRLYGATNESKLLSCIFSSTATDFPLFGFIQPNVQVNNTSAATGLLKIRKHNPRVSIFFMTTCCS